MRIVLFDIDGTLLLSGGAAREAFEQAFTQVFGCPVRQSVDFHGRPDRANGASLMACHGIEDSLENWSRLRDAYLRLLPQKLASRRGTVLPGVRRLLDTLRRRHVILGLLTGNLRQAARIKLSHYGLLEPFGSKPVGGFGDEHYDRDHVAQCALEALHQATGQAVETSQIWVVGDTPLDIRCARAIGARVLAVATGFFKREELEGYSPDATIEDFNALFAGYVPHWSEWLSS